MKTLLTTSLILATTTSVYASTLHCIKTVDDVDHELSLTVEPFKGKMSYSYENSDGGFKKGGLSFNFNPFVGGNSISVGSNGSMFGGKTIVGSSTSICRIDKYDKIYFSYSKKLGGEKGELVLNKFASAHKIDVGPIHNLELNEIEELKGANCSLVN